MVYLAKAPVSVVKKSFHGSFNRDYQYHNSCYAFLEVDGSGRIKFIIKTHDTKKHLHFYISKSHLYDMLMFHLTFKPIDRYYPLQHKKDKKDNHLWIYDKELSKCDLTQFADIDTMTPDEIKKLYEDSVFHMKKYIVKAKGARKDKATEQLNALIDRQWKIDVLYESEKAKRIFKLEAE